MLKTGFVTILLAVGTIAAGCQKQDQKNTPASTPSAVTARTTDQWLGRWNGAEGTYLELSRSDGKYTVAIKDLDRTNTYAATAASENIRFTRNGGVESIHAGNGEQTGMKWLAGKKDCLVIRPGEGYCRD